MLRGDPADQPRDLGTLLESLLENATALGGAAFEDGQARDFLGAIEGKGKAAAVANELLRLEGTIPARTLARARLLLMKARIARAVTKRMQSILDRLVSRRGSAS